MPAPALSNCNLTEFPDPVRVSVGEPLEFILLPPLPSQIVHGETAAPIITVISKTQADARLLDDTYFDGEQIQDFRRELPGVTRVGDEENRLNWARPKVHQGCGYNPPHPAKFDMRWQNNRYAAEVLLPGRQPYSMSGRLPDAKVEDEAIAGPECPSGMVFDAAVCDCVEIIIDVDPDPDPRPRLIGADDPPGFFTPPGVDTFFGDPPPGGFPFFPPPFDPELPPMGSGADLGLTKEGFPDPVSPGTTLTYTITTFNRGPDPATGVMFTDTLPPNGLELTGFDTSQGTCSGDLEQVSCDLGNILANDSVTVTVETVVVDNPPPTLFNTASVAGNEPDPFPGNNTATFFTTVDTPPTPASADLLVSKTDMGLDPVAPGAMLRYGLDWLNMGPDTATNVTIVDTLPPGMVVTDLSSILGATCTQTGNVLTCDAGSIPPGTRVTSQFTVIVPEALAGTTVVNTATISAAETDPDTSNNTATEPTTISGGAPPPADLCALGVPNNSNGTGDGGCGFSVRTSCYSAVSRPTRTFCWSTDPPRPSRATTLVSAATTTPSWACQGTWY